MRALHRLPSPALIVAALALLVALGGVAVAAVPSANGTITACFDKKKGDVRIIDAGSGATCTAKETQVQWQSGSTGKVSDSDLLDGLDSSAFLGVGGKAADSDLLDGLDSTAFLGIGAKAADSDKLDGQDATAFAAAGHNHDAAYLGKTAKAVDADRLDGIDSSSLVLHCPAGTTRSIDICYSARSEGTFTAAWFDCINRAQHLPSMSELVHIWRAQSAADTLWSGDFASGGKTWAQNHNGGGVLTWIEAAHGDTHGYRCVARPTNSSSTASSSTASAARAGASAGFVTGG